MSLARSEAGGTCEGSSLCRFDSGMWMVLRGSNPPAPGYLVWRRDMIRMKGESKDCKMVEISSHALASFTSKARWDGFKMGFGSASALFICGIALWLIS